LKTFFNVTNKGLMYSRDYDFTSLCLQTTESKIILFNERTEDVVFAFHGSLMRTCLMSVIFSWHSAAKYTQLHCRWKDSPEKLQKAQTGSSIWRFRSRCVSVPSTLLY